MKIDWRKELSRQGHRVMVSGIPFAMHCHHYNINLQKLMEDQLGQDGIRLLYDAAEEAALYGFQYFFQQYEQIRTIKSKFEFASTLFQNCGLGIIHFQNIQPWGGEVVSPSNHHVTGWLAKHGRRQTPGCHFLRGWIAGVMDAIFDHPIRYYHVMETQCKMMRTDKCIFLVNVSEIETQ